MVKEIFNKTQKKASLSVSIKRSLKWIQHLKLIFLVSFASCSHGRVTKLFAESIITGCKFSGTPCSSYSNNLNFIILINKKKRLLKTNKFIPDDFKNNRCTCSALGCPSLGFNSINVKQDGKYFLNTNSQEPFCLN